MSPYKHVYSLFVIVTKSPINKTISYQIIKLSVSIGYNHNAGNLTLALLHSVVSAFACIRGVFHTHTYSYVDV